MYFINCIFPKYMLIFASHSRIHSWNSDKSLSVKPTTTTKKNSSDYLSKIILLEKVYQQNQSKNALGICILHWTPEILVLSHSIVACRESNLTLDFR